MHNAWSLDHLQNQNAARAILLTSLVPERLFILPKTHDQPVPERYKFAGMLLEQFGQLLS